MERGKIFTEEEAEHYYGTVLAQKELEISEFKNILAETDVYLMVKFDGSTPCFYNNLRQPLAGSPEVEIDEVLMTYDIEKFEQLFGNNSEGTFLIERRFCCISFSFNNNILEYGYPCPPYCE